MNRSRCLLVVVCLLLGTSNRVSMASARAQDIEPFKEVISRQITLIMDGDHEKLGRTVTVALRPRVTSMCIMPARAIIQGKEVDDLVGKVRVYEREGRSMATIMKPDGKVLTQLVRVDDEWLIEQLWFLGESEPTSRSPSMAVETVRP